MYDFSEPNINEGILFCLTIVEDDRDVIFAIAASHTFVVDAFNEHSLCFALHRLKILDFVFQRNLSHDLATFAFHFFWNLVGHDGGFGASAHRVLEGVNVAETDFFGKVATFLEGLLGLAREAHDNVCGEVEVGTEGLDALVHVAELGNGVESVHPLQSIIGAALQANVHVGCQLLVLEELQKMVTELVRLNGGNADTEITVNV